MTARDTARTYLNLGWVPLPIPSGQKNAGSGWSARTLSGARASLDRDFGDKPQNIGVLLGAPSGDLVDIDLDCAEAIDLAPEFLPPTRTFGRTSKPRSHWIFLSPGVTTAKYPEPAPRGVKPQMLVELRSTGCQTVFPGSVHEIGEAIEWTDESAGLTKLDAADLFLRVSQLAGACLLVRQGMARDEAVTHARACGVSLGDHPCGDLVRKWTAGTRPSRKKPGRSEAGASRSAIDAAVAAFNRDHPGSWPRSHGRCPACKHDGSFGTMPDDPTRWYCFSSSHTEPGLQGTMGFHGDALDLAAFEAKQTRTQLLVAAGYLKPGQAPAEDLTPEFISDLGTANRLIKKHGANLRYVAGLRQWFIWDGVRWVRDEINKVLHLCAQVAREVTLSTVNDDPQIHNAARRQEQDSRIAGALRLAGVNPQVAIRVADLDSNPWLLACPNGTIDLQTGLLRSPRREDLLTRLVPHNFDPDAKCPRWERFLGEIMADRAELIEFLQRWSGYCLTADIREHAILLLVGKGRNGKSVFVEMLMYVLGAEFATPAAPGLLLAQKGERHPTELMDLLARRLVVANEVPRNTTFNEERVKSLSGGDTLKGRGMRQDFVDFKPTHKLVLCANHMPRVKDASDGFWRRLRAVPFDVSFKGREDKKLPAKLRTEVVGILAWMVRGCLVWQKEGLGDPIEVTNATNKYRDAEDLIRQFLAERDVAGALKIDVPARHLYDEYKAWCEGNGDKPAPNKLFGEDLEALGWVRRHTKTGNVWSAPPSPPPPDGEGVKAGEGSSGLIAHCARAREETNGPEASPAFTLHPKVPAEAIQGDRDWEEVVV